jgi:hypothetical protein
MSSEGIRFNENATKGFFFNRCKSRPKPKGGEVMPEKEDWAFCLGLFALGVCCCALGFWLLATGSWLYSIPLWLIGFMFFFFWQWAFSFILWDLKRKKNL